MGIAAKQSKIYGKPVWYALNLRYNFSWLTLLSPVNFLEAYAEENTDHKFLSIFLKLSTHSQTCIIRLSSILMAFCFSFSRLWKLYIFCMFPNKAYIKGKFFFSHEQFKIPLKNFIQSWIFMEHIRKTAGLKESIWETYLKNKRVTATCLCLYCIETELQPKEESYKTYGDLKSGRKRSPWIAAIERVHNTA